MPRLPQSATSQHQQDLSHPRTGSNYALRIQLLGAFRVTLGEQTISASSWRLQKARSLVKLLALAPGRQMHREQVMELLWPDLEPDAAANNLYYALHIARRALAGERGKSHSVATVLRFEHHILSLHPTVSLWIDVDAFERAAAAALVSQDVALHQAAIDLYTGDLLPEDRYEDWCISRREALRETHVTLLLAIARLHERQQAYQPAIESLQRALTADPTREEAHAALMRIYALAGQRKQALHQYAQLKEMLRRELDAEPDQESQRLHNDILAGRLSPLQPPTTPQTSATPLPPFSPTPAQPVPIIIEPTSATAGRHTPLPLPLISPPGVPRTPLIGRARERALIEAVWGVTTTHPQFVLLAGEAGVGKTRLAEETLGWAENHSVVTASTRCYASAGTPAYAPIASWLRADPLWSALFSLDALWLTDVARILPELLVEYPHLPQPGPLAESWQRQRFEQALMRSLFIGNTPLLLLLDDVQWCDRETLHWLHALFQTRPSTRLMIIATLRQEDYTPDHPLHPLLQTLRRNGQLTEVSVSPLDEHDTAALAVQIAMRELEPALAQRIYRETEGNPLFVVETVRTGFFTSQEDTSPQRDQTSQKHVLASALPPTVQAVITARLSQLSQTAYELVQIASVIGREFAFDLLAHASGKDEDTLLSGIDELWQRRIIREHEGDTYDFSHDKLREVAYTSLSSQRRRVLHRRVAHSLEIIHADAPDMVHGQIAAQYLQAGEPERAIAHLERAGDNAWSIFANAEAEQSYRELLRWLERLHRSERAARVREKLGEILTRTAQYDEALTILQQATDTHHAAGDAEGEIRALARIGHVHRWHGTLETGLALLQPLEQSLSTMGVSQRTQAEFYLALAALFREYSHSSEQLIMARRASECAQAVRNVRFQAQALELRGSALVALGQLDEASRVLEETIPLAEASGDLENLREALNEMAVAYRAQGEFDLDHQYTQRALVVSERIGNPSDIAFILHRRGVCSFCIGEWSQARADLDQAEAMVRAIGTSWASAYPLLGLGLLHLAEGRRDLATQYLEEASELARRAGDLQGLRWAQIGLAERDILEGHPALARDRLEPLGDRSDQQESLVTVFLPLLARAYTDLGDDARATQVVEQALTRTTAQHLRPAQVDALRSKANLAAHQGRWDAAQQALDEALTLAAAMHYPYGHARVLHEYGMLHAACGNVEQAHQHLQASHDILNRLGERLYAEHVESALASLGPPDPC